MSNKEAVLFSGDKNNSETPRFKKPYNKPRRSNDYRHNQLGDQLGALFNLTKGREGHARDINSIGVEGVDHINVSRHSTTHLGFLLAPTTKLGFKLFNRNFSTVENLLMFYRSWCTIGSLATADYSTINEIRNGSLKDFPHFANIYVVVCLAYVSIFKKHTALLDAMDRNMLVLDSYKEQNKVRSRPNTGLILVRAINEAYSSVIEKRHPNLSIFMNRDDGNNYRAEFDKLPYNENFSLNEFIEMSFTPEAVQEYFKANYIYVEKPKEDEASESTEQDAKEDTPLESEDEKVDVNEDCVDIGSDVGLEISPDDEAASSLSATAAEVPAQQQQ